MMGIWFGMGKLMGLGVLSTCFTACLCRRLLCTQAARDLGSVLLKRHLSSDPGCS